MKKLFAIVTLVAVLLAPTIIGIASACVGDGMSPGFWKHNLGVYLEEANGSYSDSNNPLVNKNTMESFFAGLEGTYDLDQLYDDLCTQGGGSAGAATRVNAANVFNDEADLFPY